MDSRSGWEPALKGKKKVFEKYFDQKKIFSW